jgi:NNP family nitrate/nitrite transporter-like MFS transporter
MTSHGEKQMGAGDLFRLHRIDIRALHKTWFAFFLTFYVWFNMAPLATTIMADMGLTIQQMKLLFICNVALTAPGRVIVGMLTDRFGPRKTFTVILIVMAIPCFFFAFADSYVQLLVSRLVLSLVGTGFVVGIHMTSLWFKPRDIGFAQGVEAGLGNWGSSIAAMTIPIVALNVFGGAYGWRYAIATSGVIMMAYGFYFFFGITDGPTGVYHKSSRGAAIEVSTWGDLINAICWTIPTIGVISILVWKITQLGFLSATGATICYVIIALVVLYQVIQLLRVNTPILKAGVPEDDKYRFTDVACLCTCYVSCFGVELGIVSMLPMFYQKTFALTPQLAGFVGAFFAFTNFFARPLGGFISDRSPSRRASMLVTLAFITAGMVLLGLFGGTNLYLTIFLTIITALGVMAAEGTTFALVPLIKRRLTGQISGYVGAYGNVGAIVFLTAYTFLTDTQFFLFIGAVVCATFLFNLFFLKEPAGAFAGEYQLSSVDRAMMEGDQ